MRYKVVAIRDRAVDVYGQPTFVANIGSAIRAFGDEVRRTHTDERPNQLNLHSDDFDLYSLGEYDDSTGIFHTGTPEQIAIGKDYKG